MKIPEFSTVKEKIDFLVKNQDKIIAAKKAQMKCADAVSFGCLAISKAGDEVDKANKPVTDDIDQVKVKAVINTTNLMDSHDDVHLPGLWTKSLRENKDIFHDQEHRHGFDSTIADYEDLKAYTQVMTWKELGFKWEGETEALIFDSTVKQERNAFMFGQYKAARVRNHSVGMQYVKIFLAVNDKEYPTEKKVWDKYIDQVVNKDEAEKQGYFFAVTEAKVIEGSAVKRGSNWATPTLENNMKEEPSDDTPKEPVKTTLNSDEIIKRIYEHFKN